MSEFNVKEVFEYFNDFSEEGFRTELNNFLNSLDCLSKEKARSKFKGFCDELVAMKKSSDSLYDDYGKLCDLARNEGYFYCVCCNKWKKPLPQ